jgi:hypothetical protein
MQFSPMTFNDMTIPAGAAAAAPARQDSDFRLPGSPPINVNDGHQFDMSGDVALLRLQGRLSHEQTFRLVKLVIAAARHEQVGDLLIDTSALQMFETPSLAMRHFMFREWARTAGAAVRLAFVAKVETADPERIEIIAARNSGATAEMFSSQTEALAWLRNPR